MAELNEIHKIAESRKDKDLFALLIKSICPSIFGHELVKTGLVLSLFGGTDYRLKHNNKEFAELLYEKNNGLGGQHEEEMEDNA